MKGVVHSTTSHDSHRVTLQSRRKLDSDRLCNTRSGRLSKRCAGRPSHFTTILVICAVVLFRKSTEASRTSSLKCALKGSCVLKNVFLDESGVFHYVGAKASEAKLLKHSLNRIKLVAAAQMSPGVYNTSLRFLVHQRDALVIQKLATRFVDGPVFFHNMVAVGNFGHTLLQNCLPAVVSMHRSPLKHRGVFQTIVGNDCKNCGLPDPHAKTCMDGTGSFGYAACDALGRDVYTFVTGYPMKYSRELFSREISYVHFSQVVIGFPDSDEFDLLHNPGGDEFMLEKKIMRQRALYNSSDACEAMSIFVYCKNVSFNGRHGNTFHNCEEFIQMLIASTHNTTAKIIVRSINFDNVSFSDQLVTLQKADIYISDGGSSSYYSHFLRTGATAMTFPLCDRLCLCTHFFAERGAYRNPDVKHVPIDPRHVRCDVRSGTTHHGDSFFMPLFRVKKSFLFELRKEMSLIPIT